MKENNYTNAHYSVSIVLTKPPSDVFDHIVDLSQWWPENFSGENIGLDSEFVLSSGNTHFSKNKVIEFIPDRKVAWLTTESIRKTDNYDWSGTKMIFELTPFDDDTLLKFTYDGVVLENESDRLIQICDITIKDLLYNFIINGKGKNLFDNRNFKSGYVENKNFTVTTELETSVHNAFRYITVDVSKWWGRNDFHGNSIHLNDEFTIHHPGTHFSRQRLIDVIPDKKVVWLVTESRLDWLTEKGEWTGTKMIFELTAHDDKTLLRFTHEGLIPEKECYDKCAQGWNTVIKEWLPDFITGNEGE